MKKGFSHDIYWHQVQNFWCNKQPPGLVAGSCATAAAKQAPGFPLVASGNQRPAGGQGAPPNKWEAPPSRSLPPPPHHPLSVQPVKVNLGPPIPGSIPHPLAALLWVYYTFVSSKGFHRPTKPRLVSFRAPSRPCRTSSAPKTPPTHYRYAPSEPPLDWPRTPSCSFPLSYQSHVIASGLVVSREYLVADLTCRPVGTASLLPRAAQADAICHPPRLLLSISRHNGKLPGNPELAVVVEFRR